MTTKQQRKTRARKERQRLAREAAQRNASPRYQPQFVAPGRLGVLSLGPGAALAAAIFGSDIQDLAIQRKYGDAQR
jgi:hypothetical protein